MSTRGIREALKRLAEHEDGSAPWTLKALAEVEAIEQAAKDFDRLSVGDFTYNIREHAASDRGFKGNTWEHPDVKAFSDAAELMGRIAESAPVAPVYPGVDAP